MKIERTKVTEQIVSYLKEQIQTGTWKVGEKIPSEHQLMEALGVSRASIRAAIGQLVGNGVLESRHGKGTYLLTDRPEGEEGNITAADCRDVEKVLEFRRILEPEGCFLAAKRGDGSLSEDLEKIFQTMKECGEEERDRFVEADLAFHERIARASGNLLLEKTLHKVFEETLKNHRQMNKLFGSSSGLYHHGRILESLREGRGEEAEERMREHLQSALDKLQEKPER